MSLQTCVQEQARPQQSYKRRLFEQLMSFAPESLLDVGCGEAELMKAAALAGCARCTGIEVDEATASKGRNQGLDVRLGRAESLPFADGSYDVVTFDYVAHHVEFLGRALLEAVRVARRAVLILDPWYDVSLPSQRTALAIDDWLKVIDRRLGRVHNPCIEPAWLATTFHGLSGFRVEYSCHLVYQPMPLSKVETMARDQLASIGGCPKLERELVRILDDVRLHGVTDDGAFVFCAQRAASLTR